ncbi:pseudouridine synthase [Nodosilinea sp. LEGE 07298]|uniref:pseudouridine synthase n=1 Tax=Nodosilinea sp. LEGE 07298 TaxID=2777970 RepID=UPI0018813586|nr:pseudouridine synthase [Nodosilinea sp. LEGE 07298]MBE9110631.1 pseudouridine synthase [Nodosilinea sp. LEGE 07298]
MAHQYILFYKPYNVLSQFSEGNTPPASATEPRLTLKDFVPVSDVYPVGRLDRDSEGLMLLTNHGRVQHRLSDPRFAHPRTYWVQVEQVPSVAALTQLQKGITIKGYRTLPCQVKRLRAEPTLPPRDPPIRFRQSIPTVWLEMTLQEGKNRQVRRMTAAVGHPTLRLVRIAIAHLQLGTLSPGQWRVATTDERQKLLQI